MHVLNIDISMVAPLPPARWWSIHPKASCQQLMGVHRSRNGAVIWQLISCIQFIPILMCIISEFDCLKQVSTWRDLLQNYHFTIKQEDQQPRTKIPRYWGGVGYLLITFQENKPTTAFRLRKEVVRFS